MLYRLSYGGVSRTPQRLPRANERRMLPIREAGIKTHPHDWRCAAGVAANGWTSLADRVVVAGLADTEQLPAVAFDSVSAGGRGVPWGVGGLLVAVSLSVVAWWRGMDAVAEHTRGWWVAGALTGRVGGVTHWPTWYPEPGLGEALGGFPWAAALHPIRLPWLVLADREEAAAGATALRVLVAWVCLWIGVAGFVSGRSWGSRKILCALAVAASVWGPGLLASAGRDAADGLVLLPLALAARRLATGGASARSLVVVLAGTISLGGGAVYALALPGVLWGATSVGPKGANGRWNRSLWCAAFAGIALTAPVWWSSAAYDLESQELWVQGMPPIAATVFVGLCHGAGGVVASVCLVGVRMLLAGFAASLDGVFGLCAAAGTVVLDVVVVVHALSIAERRGGWPGSAILASGAVAVLVTLWALGPSPAVESRLGEGWWREIRGFERSWNARPIEGSPFAFWLQEQESGVPDSGSGPSEVLAQRIGLGRRSLAWVPRRVARRGEKVAGAVVIPEDVAAESMQGLGSARFEWSSDAGAFELRTQLTAPAWVVLAVAPLRGLRVVDSRSGALEELPVCCVDGAFVGVRVPGGRRRFVVEWRRDPSGLSMWVALVGLGLLAFAFRPVDPVVARVDRTDRTV